MGVRFGLRVPTEGRPQDTGAFAQQVEAAGLDFLWTPDTPFSPAVGERSTFISLALPYRRRICAWARALMALDIDAIWWRDEASYTRPAALLQGLAQEVLPHLRDEVRTQA